MAETNKTTPGGAPSAPGELAQAIQTAIQDPERSQGIQIRMTIEGGHAEELYRFHFEASGGGWISSDMSCQMTGRNAQARDRTLARDELVDLLRSADIAKLIAVRHPLRRIPPCSLLGRVEISDGLQKVEFVFMADPGQAQQAGMEPPAELSRLIDRIFELSAKHMDVAQSQSLRP